MGVLMFNDTFNNILFKLWRSVLFVEETGVSEENQTLKYCWGRRGDRLVVGFTTTYAISAYHH
jgi:hypothetical protein